MKVFLTGGAGFVGAAVIKALLARDHSIHALVNQRPIPIINDRVKSFEGDLFDNTAVDRAMADCDAVIHLVGIIAERGKSTFDRIHYQGARQIVDASRRAGIRRYLHMSALGAQPDAPARYHQSKGKAEQYVQSSELDWTIFQPSLIHGPGGDFSKMEENWVRGKSLPFFFMPYFGAGPLGTGRKSKIQPVYVEDVARAFAEALLKDETIGQIFQIGGAEQMTWPQMHRIAAEIIRGKPKATIPIPAWYAGAIAKVLPSALLPFTADQVLMSQQDNTCDLSKFERAFGWIPEAFGDAIRHY